MSANPKSLSRRRVLALSGAFGVVASVRTARAAADLSLDAVIERHTQARGGKARLDRVQAQAVDM
jgi:hypothetical protein